MLKNSATNQINNLTENQFVSLSTTVRYCILVMVLTYTMLIGISKVLQWNTGTTVIYLSLIGYLIVLMLPIVFFRYGWGLFHPLVFLSLWTFFRDVLPSTFLYINGLDSHRALSSLSEYSLNYLVAEGLMLETVSLLMMYLGFIVSPKFNWPVISWGKPKNLKIKLLIVAFISLVALLVLANSMGGVGNLLLQRGMASDERASAQLGGGHWTLLATLLIPACLVAMSLKKQIIYSPLFLLLFSSSLVIKFVTSGSRSGVIIPLILFLIIWSIQQKKIPYTRVLVVGLVGVILLGFLGNFREVSREVSSIESVQVESNITNSFESGIEVFTTYSGEVNGLYPILEKVSQDEDMLYGSSYLAMLSAPIPRIIWPQKPEAAGKLTSITFFNNPESAIPPGSLGEAYWNLQIWGVIIVFFIWGMFLKNLTAFYLKNVKQKGIVSFYAITILLLAPNGTAYYDWFQMIVPGIVFLIFCCGIPKFSWKVK